MAKIQPRLTRFVAAMLFLAATLACAADYKYVLYVGTYTNKDSKGIYSFRFDPASGEIRPVELATETPNPSFLAVDRNTAFLYAVNELDVFDGNMTGAVSVFGVDRETYKLKLLQEVSSAGAGPAHISLDNTGRFVLAANYNGGNIAVFPIGEDGRVVGTRTAFFQYAGSSVNKDRQSAPHAHEIATSADNRFVFVPDLGTDKLMVYRFDAATGGLTPGNPAFVKVQPGSGPRHFAMAPSGKFVYLVNELSSTVMVFAFDSSSGQLHHQQTVSTIPRQFTGKNTTAEIEVDAGGKFLYVSNRGDDSIAVFVIDPRDGKLTLVERMPTGGKTPRHFKLDPTGKWMFAANQDSNTINLFAVDATSGRLTTTSHSVQVPAPVCVVILSLK